MSYELGVVLRLLSLSRPSSGLTYGADYVFSYAAANEPTAIADDLKVHRAWLKSPLRLVPLGKRQGRMGAQELRFFSWYPAGDFDAKGRPDPNWSVDEPQLPTGIHWWDLDAGRYIDDWPSDVVAEFDEDVEPTDFPLADHLLPLHSPRLKDLIAREGLLGDVQYLPLRLRGRQAGLIVEGYCVANYLCVLDCLDRGRSQYETWTKDNLLFWEKRESMLGTFRDIYKCVLDRSQIAANRLFRLWGWSTVLVREDVKAAIESAGITGCIFREVQTA